MILLVYRWITCLQRDSLCRNIMTKPKLMLHSLAWRHFYCSNAPQSNWREFLCFGVSCIIKVFIKVRLVSISANTSVYIAFSYARSICFTISYGHYYSLLCLILYNAKLSANILVCIISKIVGKKLSCKECNYNFMNLVYSTFLSNFFS